MSKVTPVQETAPGSPNSPALAKVRAGLRGWLGQSGRVHLLVIFLYTLIVLIFTFPLGLHLTDQSLRGYDYVMEGVPFDRDQFIWDMWWVKKSLLDFQLNPYHTTYLYYPYGVDLYLQSLTPVNGILGLFFYGWLGWLGAYNVVILIIMVWCGHSAYLLTDYLLKDKASAFVAGIFFTLAPQHYFNLHHAQLNVITLQFLPLYLLYLLKLDHLGLHWRAALKSRRWWGYSVLTALTLGLCTISDQYLLLFALIITGLYYLWRGLPLLLKRDWSSLSGLVARTLPALLLAGIGLTPFLYATWRTINNGQWDRITNEAVPSDFVAFFLPPVNNIFLGAKGSEFGRHFFVQPDPRAYSIGLVGLAITVYATVRVKGARWWGFLALVCIVLALGSEVRLTNQSSGILLPGYWLNKLPVFEVMRYSKRWAGPASLAIAVAVAYALHFHLSRLKAVAANRWRLKQAALTLAVLAVFLLEAEPWPVALSGDLATLPRAYANQVLPKTDHRAILELPFYQKYTAKANEMYWQTAHERPIVGGYISRVYKLDYNDTPFSYFVDGYRPDQPDFIRPDPIGLRNLLAYYDFGYIAVYKTKLDPREVERWRSQLKAILGPDTRPYYEDDQLIFYQVADRASMLAQPAQPILLRGTGWGAAEKLPDGAAYRWLLAQQATLPLYIPPGSAGLKGVNLQFRASAYYRDRTVEVQINGQPVSQLKIVPQVRPYTLQLDPSWLKTGDNLITLRPVEPPDRPSDIEKSQDTRPLTILISNLNLDLTAG